MCSVTFWPKRGGYLLGMNRDESLMRIAGLPPARFAVGSRTAVHPSEPGGGTWISVNDRGVSVALINWYAITARAPQPAASRGDVVRALRDCGAAEEMASRCEHLPLARMNPFRVIGFFPGEAVVQEWSWDRRELVCRRHDWSPRQWLSSGHDEPAAQRIRSGTFEAVKLEADAGSGPWFRRLHASHEPQRGPFSTCMHRADAATVSYTEVEVTGTKAVMRHCLGPLCCAPAQMNETTCWLANDPGSAADGPARWRESEQGQTRGLTPVSGSAAAAESSGPSLLGKPSPD